MARRKSKRSCIYFWLIFIAIAIVYFGSLAYLRADDSCKPSNIVIEVEGGHSPSGTSTQETEEVDTDIQASFGENKEEQRLAQAKAVGPTYLSEITAFYERVITILSVIIGIVLVVGFGYVHLTSKSQADDMARGALETESFRITLEQLINKKIKSDDELAELFSKYPELFERIEALEKYTSEGSYVISEEPSEEENNGNN